MASDLEYGKGSALWKYWTHGEGFAKWASALHKWTTLRRLLLKEGVPPGEVDGLTTNIIQAVMPGYMKQAHAKGHRMSATNFTRSYPLDDIKIRSGGDGRTVEAYAAVFDVPKEIHDRDGNYHEVISRSAFDRTIAARGDRLPVLYNHGLTIHGTPSDLGSVPLGRSIEMRADGRGLFTVARYNADSFTDRILESIKNGDITAQSFAGRMVQSKPERGPYRRSRSGELTTVTRNEIQLREFGPTPFPAYEEASILGVRAVLEAAYRLGGVSIGGGSGIDALGDTDAEGSPEDEAMDMQLMKLLSSVPPEELAELCDMAEAMVTEGAGQ